MGTGKKVGRQSSETRPLPLEVEKDTGWCGERRRRAVADGTQGEKGDLARSAGAGNLLCLHIDGVGAMFAGERRPLLRILDDTIRAHEFAGAADQKLSRLFKQFGIGKVLGHKEISHAQRVIYAAGEAAANKQVEWLRIEKSFDPSGGERCADAGMEHFDFLVATSQESHEIAAFAGQGKGNCEHVLSLGRIR
jgi:hypothetical protein